MSHSGKTCAAPFNPFFIHHPTAGFSLVEVLVTTLLIAIAMLGMAALQGRAITYTTQASQRSTAAMLANDLLEQARATPMAWSRYLLTAAPAPASTTCSRTPSQPAAQLACWLGEVGALLPAATELPPGATYVCLSPATGRCAGQGSTIEIQVAWKARRGECLGADQRCIYRLRSDI